MGIGLILLAAGGSRRMGRPKQLETFSGCTLLRRAAEAAAGSKCRPVTVVLGCEAERCAAELERLSVTVAYNRQWAEGMAGSIRIGLELVVQRAPEAEAAIICLCDQPHVDSALIDALADLHRTTGKPIVASRYGDSIGAPALFAASLFPELRALRGDEGARRLLRLRAEDVATVPFPGGEIDIDTPADLRRFALKGESGP